MFPTSLKIPSSCAKSLIFLNRGFVLQVVPLFNLARVDSSSPLCWSQAQEKREGWKPHFCKTTHTQNPQRNTTHRHQPRNSDLFKFFRGRTPGLIAWAVAMKKPEEAELFVEDAILVEDICLGNETCLSDDRRPPTVKGILISSTTDL
nr:unnamed protein product [Callosobruchus chinensis]